MTMFSFKLPTGKLVMHISLLRSGVYYKAIIFVVLCKNRISFFLFLLFKYCWVDGRRKDRWTDRERERAVE